MAIQHSSKTREKVRKLPNSPGIYMMKDQFGSIIYVGKAKNLKKRVSTYFQPSRSKLALSPKIAALVQSIHDFDVVEVKSEPEALLLEGRLIKQWKPKYNTDFVDDKRFLLVRLEADAPLPKFRLARFKKDDTSRYFGPFAHSSMLRRALAEMRKTFGILLGDSSPRKLEDGRWILYEDARAEIYGHANIVTEEEYAERVEAAAGFLEGKSKEWLKKMKEDMAKAAANQEFEKAAELRDAVFALEKTLLRTRKFARDPKSLNPVAPDQAMEELRVSLDLPTLPRRMECFDISHISGTFCVASMVHFFEGAPNKNEYRRFKIKSFVGNDDFRAMHEVVGRRYKRLFDEGRPYPDLIIIDGGRGQVMAALRAFLEHELEPPPIIGLAKKRETIIFTDERKPLNLPYHNSGLRLLQRLRNEAHRFANTFNADLRSKRMKETLLDDFAGLGPVRRKALLDHFRNMNRLRQATVEELQEVNGIGPKMAASLHAFLGATNKSG